MTFQEETPSHKSLPPIYIGEDERAFTVRATFTGTARCATLRFTDTVNPWAFRARFVELVAFNSQSPEFGWRDSRTAWRALTPAQGVARSESSEIIIEVTGRIARVHVNGSLVGEFESDALATCEYVKAYPDEEGDFPYGLYPNADAAGRLESLITTGPIPAWLWALFGTSLGLGVMSFVLVAFLYARANKVE